jgi:hypothetical protein
VTFANENGDGLTDYCWFGEHTSCSGSSKEIGDYGAEFGAAEPCRCPCHKANSKSSDSSKGGK